MENTQEFHKYPFAINDDGKPVHIDELTQENRKSSHYKCYGCGAELFPVLGDIREHHFRHEKGCTCDPDRYLHEFAKAAFKKRFDENTPFIVTYNTKQICSNAETCDFKQKYNWPECEKNGLYTLDLKSYYDTCTPEKGYYQELPGGKKKYIADIILTNSKKTDIPPISIEIWVTHECTEDKKMNGGQIIEIKINNEDDIKRPIIESNDNILPIRFYNFNIPTFEPNRKFNHIKILKYFHIRRAVTDETLCSEGLTFDPKGENEIIISRADIPIEKQEILYSTICNEKNYRFPKCQLCEHNKNIKDDRVSCKYARINGHPCKLFKYDKQKGDSIKKGFEYPFWENNNSFE